MKAIVIMILLCMSHLTNAAGTDTRQASAKQAGFDLGYGFQQGLQVNYVHRVYFFQLKYISDILHKPFWSLAYAVLPQFNVTRYKISNNSSNIDSGIEYGMHAALIGRYFIRGGRNNVFLMLSIGPHYVSGVPQRQTPGFLFSDNVMLGGDVSLWPGVSLSLTGGFRHISNASIKQPNGGINNLMVFTGLTFDLNKVP